MRIGDYVRSVVLGVEGKVTDIGYCTAGFACREIAILIEQRGADIEEKEWHSKTFSVAEPE